MFFIMDSQWVHMSESPTLTPNFLTSIIKTGTYTLVVFDLTFGKWFVSIDEM